MREQIAKIFREDFETKLLGAIEEQKRAAAFYHNSPPAWMEGIGERVMAVDPLLDWIARQKFGDAALDPDFWKWARRNEPAFQVRSVSPKTMVGYTAPSAVTIAPSGNVRERKVYPCPLAK